MYHRQTDRQADEDEKVSVKVSVKEGLIMISRDCLL